MVLVLPPSNEDAQRTLVISMKASKLLQFPSLSLFFLATPCGMWDLSFKTSDQIHAYCIGALGAWSLNHWTAKEVLHSLLYSLGMMLAKDDSPMAAESDTTEQLNWTEGYLSWTSSFSVDSPSLFRWQKMCISFPAALDLTLIEH